MGGDRTTTSTGDPDLGAERVGVLGGAVMRTRTVRTVFDEEALYGTKRGKCGRCGRTHTRRQKFYQTVNPWNRGARSPSRRACRGREVGREPDVLVTRSKRVDWGVTTLAVLSALHSQAPPMRRHQGNEVAHSWT